MPTLDRHDTVLVLDLGDIENRFHPEWLAAVDGALDEVVGAEGLVAHPDQHEEYVISVHALLARMLALPVITVAAL